MGLLAPLAVSHGDCWPEWSELASFFETFFIEDGTCSDAARGSIRLAFHDCFPGACDGSILNAKECWDRPENAQMVHICSTLAEKADDYGLGTADVIQFAAGKILSRSSYGQLADRDKLAIGLASCNGGPVISFHVGRQDSIQASPLGTMPNATTDPNLMVDMFAARGFSKWELVALAGAHTVGRQLDGAGMDSTVGEWDHRFYSEVANNTAPHPVLADVLLTQDQATSLEWRVVGESQKNFMETFVRAMEKLSLMGSNKKDLVDCSDIVKSYAGRVKEQKTYPKDSDGFQDAKRRGSE